MRRASWYITTKIASYGTAVFDVFVCIGPSQHAAAAFRAAPVIAKALNWRFILLAFALFYIRVFMLNCIPEVPKSKLFYMTVSRNPTLRTSSEIVQILTKGTLAYQYLHFKSTLILALFSKLEASCTKFYSTFTRQ